MGKKDIVRQPQALNEKKIKVESRGGVRAGAGRHKTILNPKILTLKIEETLYSKIKNNYKKGEFVKVFNIWASSLFEKE